PADSRRRAARLDLSRLADGHRVAAACGAAAGAGAVQFVGTPGNQRSADARLFLVERSDGAARGAVLLHRKAGAAAQSVDLLRADSGDPGQRQPRRARPAAAGDGVLERAVAVQVSAAI